MAPRIQEQFQTEILPKLADALGRTNPHSLPLLTKIVVSMGVGEARESKGVLDSAVADLTVPVLRQTNTPMAAKKN